MSVWPPRLRIRRALLLLLAFLALASPLRAERLILKSYTTAEGLPHDSINCVVEDARGYLWFCTDDGLSRFDGYQFTNYGVGDGLPSAIVNAVLPTPDGRLWIATADGLVRFDPHGPPASARATPERSSSDWLRDGRFDAKAAPAMFTTFVSGLEGQARYVTSLLQDRAGVVWVGTHDGLYRLTVAQGQPVGLAAVDVGLPYRDNHREVTCLMEDRRGALWIGTMRGLHRRSADGRAEPIAHSPLPDAWPIHALLEDRDGRVWVGTRYAGLFLLAVDPASHRPTVTRVHDGRRDLPTNWITTIVQSADGAVWVGTNRGVIQFLKDTGRDAYRIRVYSTSEETDEVWAIAEDRQHNLWLGRSHVGVAKLWNRGLTKFAAPDGLSWATSINATRTGDLIAMGGVDRMLSRFDGTKFVASRFPIPGVTPGWGWSQTVLQDRTGDWWIGTGQGLFRFTNLATIDDVPRSSPMPMHARAGFAAPQVFRLFEDSGGDIWIGTIGEPSISGLSRWQRKTGTFRHYTTADGLPGFDKFYVTSFAEDRAGHAWIGFSGLGGLVRHRDGRFVRFTSADGVPPGRISNLLVDSKGRLWAATDRAEYSGLTLPTRRVPGSSRTPRHRACRATSRVRWSKTTWGASTSGPAGASTASIRQPAASGTTRAPMESQQARLARCATGTARCGSTRPKASCAWCPSWTRFSVRRRFSLPLSPSGAVRARSPRLASRTCACSSRRRATRTSRSISSRSDSATVKSCFINTCSRARRPRGAGPPPGAR